MPNPHPDPVRDPQDDFLNAPTSNQAPPPSGAKNAVDLGTRGRSPSPLSPINGGVSPANQPEGTMRTDPRAEGSDIVAGLVEKYLDASSDLTDAQIGPYKVVSQLGEGGFGVVYLAQQHEPFQRQVALKVIKPGMDSREILARFDAERAALSLMNHPCIAKVLDAGSTRDGRPYFVMEYVKGVPITRFCDDAKLNTRQRLELFMNLCEGVQHAHQKGVIHRDLKPTNILVALMDSRPLPKIIDFGLAKALSRPLTEHTLYTEKGQLIGTPEYMAPEQAGTTGLDVDTRADIYSLGVLLYQLLVGMLPFDSRVLREAGFAGVIKIIREQEPPRMSVRLSGMGAAQAEAAAKRAVDPRSLARQVRGDLEWITLRAMEKDRSRRYQTASEFADDIRRYLNNQPVIARPPSLSYRASRFVQRNKVSVAAGGTIAVGLTAAAIIASLGLVEARQANAALQDEQNKVVAANTQLTTERDRAEAARRSAERVTKFTQEILASVNPSRQNRQDVTVREVLDEAARRIPPQLEDDPFVQAAVRATIGRTYTSLGMYETAEPQLQGALATQLQDLPQDDLNIAATRHYLGLLYLAQRKPDQALTFYQPALESRRKALGEASAEVGSTLGEVAQSLFRLRRTEEAITAMQDSVEIRKKSLPPNHPDTARALANLGAMYFDQRRLDKAERAWTEAAAMQRAAVGERSIDVALTIGNLAELSRSRRDYARAAEQHRVSLTIRRATLPADHPQILESLTNLALTLQDQGDLAAAEEPAREAVKLARGRGESGRGDTHRFVANLASVLADRGKLDEADALANEAREDSRRLLKMEDPTLGARFLLVGRIQNARNRSIDAEASLRQALSIFELAKLPPAHPFVAQTRSALGESLVLQNRLDEAGPLLTESFPAIEQSAGPKHPRTRHAMQRLLKFYQAKGDDAKAGEWRAKLEEAGG